MATSWEKFDPDATKAAMKILGPQAKIPDMIPAMDKAWETSHDAWADFTAARQHLKDVVDNLEQMEKGLIAAWETEKDSISKENFGLEPKKDKDKIAAARKPFLKRVNEALQAVRKGPDDMKKVDAAVKIIMDAQR